MMGMYKHTKDGQVTFYEFFVIGELEGRFALRLKHFTPEMVGWETKDQYVTFPLVSVSPTEILFDGLEMRKVDEDQLEVKVNVGDEDGNTQWVTFAYKRKREATL